MKKTYADICSERAEKATGGNWSFHDAGIDWWRIDSDKTTAIIANHCFPKDAEFIAHARTDVVELARRLKRACDHIRGDLYAIALLRELEAIPEEKMAE